MGLLWSPALVESDTTQAQLNRQTGKHLRVELQGTIQLQPQASWARCPTTGYLYSGWKTAFQSRCMSTTSQPRWGASLRASISLPVLLVLAS